MTLARHFSGEHEEAAPFHPWEFENAAYDQRKLAVTAASLPRLHYQSAFEAGSAIGALTELLALRCDRLLWNDLTPSWCPSDSQRGPYGGARPEERTIASQWPSGNFDLVVLNDVAGCLPENDFGCLIDCLLRSTNLGAHILAVHSRSLTNCPLNADRKHLRIAASPELVTLVHHVEAEFVLDVWERW